MTTYAFPTFSGRPAPSTLEWRLVANTQIAQSPLSGSMQTVELPGARWAWSASWANLQPSESAAMEAFLVKLRGQANRFTVPYWPRMTPRGTLSGTTLVFGAGQTGAALSIDGAGVGTTLLAGDVIGVNGELHMVATDATANGSGQMSLTLCFPLRASPADNAPVTYVSPTATFVLTRADRGWTVEAGRIASFSIDAVEVF